MKKAAIDKATVRLKLVKKAVQDLSGCTDYEAFSGVWYQFLTAAKNIYTILEQGAKDSPQSRQWFGGKANERRKDPLLQYVYQARDDEEHGLSPGTALVGGSLAFGGDSSQGQTNAIHVSTMPDGTWKVKSLDGKPVRVIERKPHVELIAVHDRSKKSYDPPDTHLGENIAGSMPIVVAELMEVYLESLVREASGLA